MQTRSRSAAILIAAGACCPLAHAQQSYRAVPLPPTERPLILPPGADVNEDIDWNTIDGGGGRLAAGPFTLDGTVGQPDVELIVQIGIIPGNGPLSIQGGFWSRYQTYPPCYANCDNSSTPPLLNV